MVLNNGNKRVKNIISFPKLPKGAFDPGLSRVEWQKEKNHSRFRPLFMKNGGFVPIVF